MSRMPEHRTAHVEARPRPELAPRQCGRCRQWFDGDPALHPGAIAAWWLCPACHTALLGDGPDRSPSTRAPTPGGTHDAR
jgi:hypothetical protein